jgi:hypothetical protein
MPFLRGKDKFLIFFLNHKNVNILSKLIFLDYFMSVNLYPSYCSTQQTFLQGKASVPSKEQAQKIFWGLGDRFWMPFMDGKYHLYGPMVFDEGLHGGDKEPGFFQSLKNGCEFASQHLGEKLTVQFYKDLHKVLCAHFKGEENNTVMLAEQAGSFRDDDSRCRMDIEVLSEESREHYLNTTLYKQCFAENTSDEKYLGPMSWCIKKYQDQHLCPIEWAEKKQLFWKNQTNIGEKLCSEYQESKKWVEKYEREWGERIDELHQHLRDLCGLIPSKPFALFRLINSTILYVDYLIEDLEQFERIVQVLFEDYNKKIDEINLRQGPVEEKIAAIAYLFQMLEWLHPFPDGQGRLDLVLLGKLLSEQGANPAILNEPYLSTRVLFSEWNEYLLKGIESCRARLRRND